MLQHETALEAHWGGQSIHKVKTKLRCSRCKAEPSGKTRVCVMKCESGKGMGSVGSLVEWWRRGKGRGRGHGHVHAGLLYS